MLDFPHVYHAKTSSFCSFPDKGLGKDVVKDICHKLFARVSGRDNRLLRFPRFRSIIRLKAAEAHGLHGGFVQELLSRAVSLRGLGLLRC